VLQVSEQEIEDFEEQEYDLEDQEASKYLKDVTFYTASFVAKILMKKISCNVCKDFLVATTQNGENDDLFKKDADTSTALWLTDVFSTYNAQT
jgi:hypothetical protein